MNIKFCSCWASTTVRPEISANIQYRKENTKYIPAVCVPHMYIKKPEICVNQFVVGSVSRKLSTEPILYSPGLCGFSQLYVRIWPEERSRGSSERRWSTVWMQNSSAEEVLYLWPAADPSSVSPRPALWTSGSVWSPCRSPSTPLRSSPLPAAWAPSSLDCCTDWEKPKPNYRPAGSKTFLKIVTSSGSY